MNILVLGGTGMAGHVIALYLTAQGHHVETLSANNRLDDSTYLVDATDHATLGKFLEGKPYHIIVNCIAILPKQAESHKSTAVDLNAYLPHYLAQYYETTPTRIIQLSTDGVFSADSGKNVEDTSPNCTDFYGRSKALGEIINDKDLTIRMSIIGPSLQPNGAGLLDWFFAQSGEITGYSKVLWNGVTTLELAKGIEAAIQQGLTGLYHFAPDVSVSKFELLQFCKQAFAKNDVTITPTAAPISTRVLANTRVDISYTIPSYSVMLHDMSQWITDHPGLYAHYDRGSV